MARTHQSSASTGSGKGGQPHLRPRRDVDGHASSSSVPPSETTASVDMHELVTPSLNTLSLVHGVTSPEDLEETTETDNRATILVSSDVSASDNIGVTNTQTSSLTVGVSVLEQITTIVVSEKNLETTTVSNQLSDDIETNIDVNTSPEVVDTEPKSNLIPTDYETTTEINKPSVGIEIQIDVNNSAQVIKTKNTVNKSPNTNDSPLEHPLEVSPPKDDLAKEDKNVAYDPSEMQNDAFPNMFSYGVQRLRYTKLLTKFKAVNDMIHLLTNDTEPETDLEKFHYDREPPVTTHSPTSPKPLPTTAVTETVTTKKPVEETTVPSTTTSAPKHVVFTTTPLSVTNPNISEEITTETYSEEEETTENITIESKTPDLTSNPKHVLINLTISADDNDNSSYKPLYSLTVTVPTAVGDGKQMPTVKITPMDVEPTQPTNFNKPITLEGKESKPFHSGSIMGGSCECSCPSCEGTEPIDDIYDDFFGKSTYKPDEDVSSSNDGTTEFEERFMNNETDSTETYTETYETSDDSSTIVTESIDLTTETDDQVMSSTAAAVKCVCPKVVPPPILILEGEVVTLKSE